MELLGEHPTIGQLGESVQHEINNHISQVNNAISQLQANPDAAEQTFVQALEKGFKIARIPVSGSTVAQYVYELRNDSPIVAAAALASWMNLPGVQLQQFEHLKGAMLMAAFDAKMAPATPSAVSKSLKNLGATLQKAFEDTNAETARQKTHFDRQNISQRKTLAQLIRATRNRRRDRKLTGYRATVPRTYAAKRPR